MNVPVILFDQGKANEAASDIKVIDRLLKFSTDDEAATLRAHRLRLSQRFLSAFKAEALGK